MTNPRIPLDADKAAATLCRRSLAFFVKTFWPVIEEDELVWNWHMEVLCNEVQQVYERTFLRYRPETGRVERLPKLYDLIINIPPGTSKSTICTVMAPVWSWICDPSLRHITGSYSAELSTEHAVKSRDILQSEKFRRYFPEVVLKADQNNKTNYRTTRSGQRFSTSTTGTVTGTHAHIITIDDPLNPRQAASAAELAEANAFFDKTLPTRKVDKKVTPMILVMQRLATNDPTGHLLEKKGEGIRHICLPGEESDHVSPAEYRACYINGLLDPHRLDRASLKELHLDLGAAGYAGQIQQLPVPEGGLIWQKWFVVVPDALFPSPEQATRLGTDWDLAYTSEEANAASAYVTSGKIGEKVYIFDLGWAWKEFPDLIHWIKTKQGPHYIEAKASGKSAKQTLTQQGVIAIEVPVKGGADKIARARSATPLAEAGQVYIKASLVDKLYHDAKQGILAFPKGQYKDLADALAQALQRHSDKGVRVLSFEDDDTASLLDQLDFGTPQPKQLPKQERDALDDLWDEPWNKW